MYQRCLFYKFMISYIDTRVSMNKHVCNFVLCCEGKRKKKNERTCYIWMESIYFTKGWKIAVPRNSTEDKKKKKRVKFVIRLEKKSCPFDDESDIEPNTVWISLRFSATRFSLSLSSRRRNGREHEFRWSMFIQRDKSRWMNRGRRKDGRRN